MEISDPVSQLEEIRSRLGSVVDHSALLEGLFAFSPVAFQIYRSDGHCLLTNQAFRDLFGSEPPPEYSILEDDIAEKYGVLELVQRAFHGETISIPTLWYDPRELRQVRVTQGKRVAISMTAFPLFDHDGRVSNVAIVFKDETVDTLAKEELAGVARRSKLLAEAGVALDEGLDVKATSERVAHLVVPQLADWCTVTVYDDDNVLRRVAVVHRDPAKAKLAKLYLNNFPPTSHQTPQHKLVGENGKPVLLSIVSDEWIKATAQSPEHLRAMHELGLGSCIMVPLRARGRLLGVVSLVRTKESPPFDSSDLVLAEEFAGRAALAVDISRLFASEHRVRRALEEAVRIRDEFLSIASHELKTPLTSLVLQIEIIHRFLNQPIPEEDRSRTLEARLKTAELQVKRINALIENLLDVSRISANRLSIELGDVDLAKVIRDVVSRLGDQIARSGCTIKLSLSEECVGRWDRLRLEQIFTNLLANAMKYGHRKPIEVILENVGQTAVLKVVDHGLGISKEDQFRIFERFERATQEHQFGGLGLGLWITRQLTHALSGEISVESTLGVGSTFTVTLPRQGPDVPSKRPG